MSLEFRHVLIIQEEGSDHLHQHVLDSSIHAIGRDPKCDIRIMSKFVSRRHATLVRMVDDDDSIHYRIVDGVPKGRASSNGIMVNGRKVLACDLQDQDVIMLGPQVRATYCLSQQDSVPSSDDTLIPTIEISEAETARYRRDIKAELGLAPDRDVLEAIRSTPATSRSVSNLTR